MNGLSEFNSVILTKFSTLEDFFQKILEEEQHAGGVSDAQEVSYKTFERMCRKHRIQSRTDLKQMFLFLDQVTVAERPGRLTIKEFRLLRGFQSRAAVGVPARLRKMLVGKFGSLEQAFKSLYEGWLPKELRGRVEAIALRQIVGNCGFVEKAKKNIGALRATLKLSNFGRMSRASRQSQSMGALPTLAAFTTAQSQSPVQKKQARRRPYIPPDGPIEIRQW